MATVSQYEKKRAIKLPIYGASADILAGAFVRRGTTPGTDNGALIGATGFSVLPDIVGVLTELHDYSVSGDTLINGTSFATRGVELVAPVRVVRMEFSLATADTIVCTQAVNSTTMTVASLEDDIDASFIYVAAGTGQGQLQYLTASAAGSATLKAAFGTSLDTSSRFVKILRRFHDLVGLNGDGTKLASQAAVGAVQGLILDISMQLGGEKVEQLNPVTHPGKIGLHNAPVKFFADVVFRNSAFYTID